MDAMFFVFITISWFLITTALFLEIRHSRKLEVELHDLKHSYREAIDGRLAAEREVEGMKAKQERLEKFFKELGQ
jgi:hypothetical protein